jgi:tetratricopeptide (TPR) repeat protein
MRGRVELVRRYPSDTSAHNNLALCAKQLRDMPTAIDEMQKAVAILPKRARYRGNLALNAVYGGDFAMGEREAQESRTVHPSYPTAFSALAFAQLGQARAGEAADTYERVRRISPPIADSGLGDLALYQGRLTEAVALFERGAAADVAAKSPDAAAEKLVALAYTQLTRGDNARAIAAAERALATGSAVKIRFLAGRILAEAGSADRAREMAAGLASQLEAEPRPTRKSSKAISRSEGRPGEAVDRITESIKLVDTWIGRFDLGKLLRRGRLHASRFEFDRCIERRGEAMALALDAEPTYGYLPPVYYYQDACARIEDRRIHRLLQDLSRDPGRSPGEDPDPD